MNRDDVINKVFPHSLFGYDPVAVDNFLDEVIREFDRMNNTIDVLKLKLAQDVAEAKQTNDMLSANLAHAEFMNRAEQLLSSAPQYLPKAEDGSEGEPSSEQEHGSIPTEQVPQTYRKKRRLKH